MSKIKGSLPRKNKKAVIGLFLGIFLFFPQTFETAVARDDHQEAEALDQAGRSGALEKFEAHPEMATIYVVREKKFKGAAFKSKIYLNYQYGGKIGNGQYAIFQVPPGEYLLGVLEDKDKRSIKLEVEAGEIYFAQLRVKMGFAKASGAFKEISEDDAKALIPKLYLVKAMGGKINPGE